MKLSRIVYAQHLGWMFKKHWQIQGKRATRELGPTTDLVKQGLELKDGWAIADNKEITSLPFKSHVNVNTLQNIGYVLLNRSSLSQGLDQALCLTKTIKIDGMPKELEERIKSTELSKTNHKNVKDAILESYYFDTQQEKNSIFKHPDRMAFIFPRTYGITEFRRNQLMVSRLISECEKISGKMISSNRKILNNDNCLVSIENDGDTIQLSIVADTIITSKCPLEPVKENYDGDIPDLYPLKQTISIPREAIFSSSSSFLHTKDCLYSNPHTIFLLCSPAEINSNHDNMKKFQCQARNLLTAFGIATSKARQMYGEMIRQLPQPVVVQSIQTDGKTFHFGIFQLNTLDLSGTRGIKNFWFSTSNIDLFTLRGNKTHFIDNYNKNILTTMSVLYNNS